MMSASRHPRLFWLSAVLPGALLLAIGLSGPLARPDWVAPTLAFWVILALTGGCVLATTAMLIVGWRRRLAEVAILGSALTTAGVLPLVHGLTVPGVLYGPNSTVSVSIFLAVPAALLVAAPVLMPDSGLSRAIARRWRTWSAGALLVTVGAAAALLAFPRALGEPSPGEPLAVAVVIASLGGTGLLAWRHLSLYRLSGRATYMASSIGISYLGLSTIVWLAHEPYSPAWWLAHFADGLGVLLAGGALLLAHRRDGGVATTLAPLLVRDPLAALEVGLTPPVHAFIAALDRKDPATREHALRVAEMALRLGERAGWSPERLRDLGIGALLHDVGKMDTPEEILKKPGKLSEAEFARIQEHTIVGGRMLEACAPLAGAAPIARWHHERWDGKGYPHGLACGEIPEEAALVGVCDSWDAMSHTRVYRGALDAGRVRAILVEGAGSQWSPRLVELLTDELDEVGVPDTPAFAAVGVERASEAALRKEGFEDVLADALPDAARALVGG